MTTGRVGAAGWRQRSVATHRWTTSRYARAMAAGLATCSDLAPGAFASHSGQSLRPGWFSSRPLHCSQRTQPRLAEAEAGRPRGVRGHKRHSRATREPPTGHSPVPSPPHLRWRWWQARGHC